MPPELEPETVRAFAVHLQAVEAGAEAERLGARRRGLISDLCAEIRHALYREWDEDEGAPAGPARPLDAGEKGFEAMKPILSAFVLNLQGVVLDRKPSEQLFDLSDRVK